MRGDTRRFVPVLLVAGVLLAGAVVGTVLAGRDDSRDERQLLHRAARIATTLVEWLPDDRPADELVYDGIRGMLEQLDPHSTFLDPRSYERMRERQEGSFFGVGIIISRRAGKVTVIAPIAGTPAARKGLRAGDVIAAVDGESTEDMSLDEVADRVRGPEGTVVRLTIERPGFSEPFDVEIERARIPTNSVRYAFLLDGDVGYIRLSEFSNTSEREVKERIAEFERRGMRSLVLDLRDNPGGALTAAIGVADAFLEKGQLVVSIRGRAPGNEQEYTAPGRGARFRGPLVVLVNTGSASASEIVAGAIQDHDRGLIVGEPTWGKGLVQTVYTIRDAGLALTTARYYTPSGRCIQRDYESFIDYITHRNGEPPPDAPVFHTDAGRPVRGGGGIHPDVVAAAEELAEPVAVLYGQSAYFRWAIHLLEGVSEAARPDFARNYRGTPEELEAFLAWVEEENLLDADQLEALRSDPGAVEEVRRALRIELLNSAVGLDAGYRVAVEGDPQVKAALAQLPEAERMWRAWQERFGKR